MDATRWRRFVLSGAVLAAAWGAPPALAQTPAAAQPSNLPPLPRPTTPAPAPAPPATVPAPAPAPAPSSTAAAEAAAAVTAEPPLTAPPPGGGGLAASLGAAPPTTDTGSLSSIVGGGGLSPVILGDMLPLTVMRAFPHAAQAIGPPPPPVPPVPPVAPPPPQPGQVVNLQRVVRSVVPSVRGFKVSENQSPRPQDRVFSSFNFYGDINGQVNRRAGGVITSMRAYRANFGFEKTFLDGNASIGMRFPIDGLTVNTPYKPIGGTNATVGNLSIFGKYVLWQDDQGKRLISTGMMVTTPTGPSRFAGSPASFGFHDTLIQPFLGFFWALDRFYAQGFTAIEVPTTSRDVTMFYKDVGIGYFLYRSEDPDACLRAFVPTFEVHVNTPLNHRGALRAFDQAGTPDVVDLTYGANTYLGRRSVLSVGVATPVTGPRPFAYEVMAILNIYYGRTARAGGSATSPPVLR